MAELEVGADVSIDVDKFLVQKALAKTDLEYTEAEINKCVGDYCVVEQFKIINDIELVQVRFKDGRQYWFPPEIVLAEEDSSINEELTLDDDNFDEKPGGNDLILVDVSVNDVARHSIRTSFASTKGLTGRRSILTLDNNNGHARLQNSMRQLDENVEDDELDVDDWHKGDIVWTKIDGHFVESVIWAVRDDPEGDGKMLRLQGRAQWVKEDEVSITHPTQYDIGYITSAPLVYQTLTDVLPLEELDLEKDEKIFLTCLQESRKEFKVVKCAASIQNLFSICNKGCHVLHYSGHGVRGFLAFENHSNSEIGNTQFISRDYLKKILTTKAGHIGVKLAVVSACHSQKAGDAFVAAGVPHVVAIKQEKALHDDAAQNFTEQFYKWLFSGNSVQTSYKAALTAVEGATNVSRHDRKLYLLLPHGPEFKHQEVLFQNQSDGDFKFNQLQQISPTNLPTKPALFVGRAIFQREVILSVLANRCVLVYGPSGEGKSELVKMAARYIHDRNLDQFTGGVVWIDLKKQYLKNACSHRPTPGGEHKYTLFNTVCSTLDEVYCDIDIDTARGFPELRSNGSRHKHQPPSRTDSGRLIDEAKYFSRIAPKMLLVLRGLEYLTSNHQMQKTIETIQELLASPASPHVLITHRQDLRKFPIPLARHLIPKFSKESVATIFSKQAKNLIYTSELWAPLAPPKRYQLRWRNEEGLYNTEYYSTLKEAKEVVEAKGKEGIKPECRDLAPNGKSLPFPIIPDLEVKTDGDDEEKIPTRAGDKYSDFLDWLTSNPKRVHKVAKFATLQLLTNPWDIISGFTLFERLESLQMICGLKLLWEGTLDDVEIKKLFDLSYLVNINRRMKWKVLKRLLSIRFSRCVGIPLKDGTRKSWKLSSYDWQCIEKMILPNCSSAKDFSLSEEGFVHFIKFFIKWENRTKHSLNLLSSIEDQLPEHSVIINLFEQFIIDENLEYAGNEYILQAIARWNKSILADASQRVSLDVVDLVLPLCFWKLLPKSKRFFCSDEITWIREDIIEKAFITRRELRTVSFNGWIAFFKRRLIPWRNMINQEIEMWNLGVFIGFCRETQCRSWLSDQEDGTFIVRFSTSRQDLALRSNAVAITYRKQGRILNSLVQFDLEAPEDKRWTVPRLDRGAKQCNCLVEVMRMFEVSQGLNPYNGKTYTLEELEKEKPKLWDNYTNFSDFRAVADRNYQTSGDNEGEGQDANAPIAARAGADNRGPGGVRYVADNYIDQVEGGNPGSSSRSLD